MMHKFHAGVAVLGTLIMNAATPAQALRPSGPQGDLQSVMRRAHGVSWQRGQLTGGGADYKVCFDAGSFELTPALGRAATKNYPVRFTLVSIDRGRERVWSSGRDAVAPRLDARAAAYDRGLGVTERVAVRPDDVELSFEFGRPLGQAGDLVVRLRVATDLQAAAHGESATGFRLHAEDIGGVKIGGVTGIDAQQRRAAGTLRFDGDYLDLVLPAAFVDSARYPLLLDPPIGPDFRATAIGSDDVDPDVAYDVSNQRYLVVWQREFSATSFDILTQRITTTGALDGSPVALNSGGIATSPTVANVNLTDQFLVCWEAASTVFGPWRILGATVDAATGAASTIVDISGSTGSHVDPDAGGEATLNDDEALVVWATESSIVIAEVTCPPGLRPSPLSTTTLPGGSAEAAPAVSKNGGSTGHHLVVWNQPSSGIVAACVTRDAVIVDDFHLITSSAGNPDEPDVDGDGTDFLVTWQQDESAMPNKHDTWCQRLACATSITSVGPATAVASDTGDDEIRPAVGFLGPKYLVAWADEVDGSPLHYDIEAVSVDLGSCNACGPVTRFTGSAAKVAGLTPQIGSRVSGGSTSDEAMIVWMDAQAVPPYSSEIWAQRFEALGSGGPVTDLGGACGPGGVAGTNGPAAIGNPNFAFTLTGADPTASIAVVVLAAPGPRLPCGPCQVTLPIAQAPRLTGPPGSASLPLALPCDLTLLGGQIQFQWWAVFSSASPCQLLPTASLSNSVVATIGQ
ncbi:MAG: hypothetical protein AAF628_13910 [Planctomycetota bacterium]